VTWNFGALSPAQEVEFIEKRLRMLYPPSRAQEDEFPVAEQLELASLMQKAQELTRGFATEHIAALSASAPTPLASVSEVRARASSVVSLRDIMFVFTFFGHFTEFLSLRLGQHAAKHGASQPLIFASEDEPAYVRRRRAMLLTISVVYYLRHSPEHRERFQRELHLGEVGYPPELRLVAVLGACMDTLISHTDIEPGIARTRGLKENIFMVVTCLSAGPPLLMVVRASTHLGHTAVAIAAAIAAAMASTHRSLGRSQKQLQSTRA
jgi:hypothetical protein